LLLDAYREYRKSLRHFRALDHFEITQEGLIYSCPLDSSKRRNLAVQSVSKRFLPWVELASPHILHVGVTTHCNLSCPACPTGTGSLWRSSRHLDFETYCRTIDGFRDSLLFVLLWDWGEPLLHPRIADMCTYAGRSGIKTVISTNGNVPLPDRKFEHLIASGLSALIVCVDGATQETYEDYRRGGSLELTIETLQRARKIREARGSRYPILEFRSLATARSAPELPLLLAMARDSGADFFSVKNVRPYDYAGHELDNVLVPREQLLSRYQYGDSSAPRAESRLREEGVFNCGKPFFAPSLTAQGELAFCHYVREPEEFFGKVSPAGVRPVWKGKTAREKRLEFGRREGTKSCESCYFRIKHKPTVMYRVAFHDDFPADIRLENSCSEEEFLQAVGALPVEGASIEAT